jgi:hypothetical protein
VVVSPVLMMLVMLLLLLLKSGLDARWRFGQRGRRRHRRPLLAGVHRFGGGGGDWRKHEWEAVVLVRHSERGYVLGGGRNQSSGNRPMLFISRYLNWELIP